ncbi:acyl carrier protein phosphodiesterase [Acaryochloris sp. IP29b_bin.137]|uniref:acyl carrier protein phosphodiesterase n=1 Tax=Acaryochloris sp. IP29b_bin.137 TaxID=2969217 RepID=UPI00261343E2|nr:acyl carrier protein phosphodiesterase [Acaryochloris sp. IP29b_bin.137]
MNWLAHLYLAQPTVEHRLGNLLADFIKGSARQQFPLAMQAGMRHHQQIDSFTDRHPIFCHSKRLMGPAHRRMAGILVDIFYDHHLAQQWSAYSDVPLAIFTRDIYRSFQSYSGWLPADIHFLLDRITTEDWLTQYQTIEGIEATLARLSQRISRRWQRSVNLCPAIEDWVTYYQIFAQDFSQFFPELIQYCQTLD